MKCAIAQVKPETLAAIFVLPELPDRFFLNLCYIYMLSVRNTLTIVVYLYQSYAISVKNGWEIRCKFLFEQLYFCEHCLLDLLPAFVVHEG